MAAASGRVRELEQHLQTVCPSEGDTGYVPDYNTADSLVRQHPCVGPAGGDWLRRRPPVCSPPCPPPNLPPLATSPVLLSIWELRPLLSRRARSNRPTRLHPRRRPTRQLHLTQLQRPRHNRRTRRCPRQRPTQLQRPRPNRPTRLHPRRHPTQQQHPTLRPRPGLPM